MGLSDSSLRCQCMAQLDTLLMYWFLFSDGLPRPANAGKRPQSSGSSPGLHPCFCSIKAQKIQCFMWVWVFSPFDKCEQQFFPKHCFHDFSSEAVLARVLLLGNQLLISALCKHETESYNDSFSDGLAFVWHLTSLKLCRKV